MKVNNTFGIHFIIRKSRSKAGMCQIYVRISLNGSRREISLKKYVKESEWDKNKGKLRGTRRNASDTNFFIEEVRSQIYEAYHELANKRRAFHIDDLKNYYLRGGEEKYTLLRLMEYHNLTFANTLSKGSLKNYRTTEKYLKKYFKEWLRVSDVFLSEINYRFLSDFEFFLRKTFPKEGNKGLSNNGIMKHLVRLKKLSSFGERLEWLEKDPFAKYQIKFDKVERGFLDQDELELIENTEFELPRLILAKDLFVFSCYTGLSYVDIMNLSLTHIIRGIDGGKWIYTTRQKTGVKVKIPILPFADRMIEKYKEDRRALDRGTIFPYASNQKLNKNLKDIAAGCGLNKYLTFHLARHTFATTITLLNGVPIETVSKVLGHTKITTTQIYAKVVESKVSDDMEKLRNILSNKEIKEKDVKISKFPDYR
ncbi:site-specific integrase [Echinicola marina]|uniref:site-specific integrase n=1 Tax=Echinicola marina TaxID=2859768 RepID=UPI001CF66795|nr:site-specific integrase [Echinicola marina]UCS92388.1 site-specific integrase [Echinicola marina]